MEGRHRRQFPIQHASSKRKRKYGFIAQDVEKIFPDLVMQHHMSMKHIKNTVLLCAAVMCLAGCSKTKIIQGEAEIVERSIDTALHGMAEVYGIILYLNDTAKPVRKTSVVILERNEHAIIDST